MAWKIYESLRERLLNGETIFLACPSLRKQYREILRGFDPDYKQESYSSCKAKIVLLEGNADVIAARLQKRASKGEHFIPLTLLHSQLELLQADDWENICVPKFNQHSKWASRSVDQLVRNLQERIKTKVSAHLLWNWNAVFWIIKWTSFL